MDLFWENDAGQIETVAFDATLREELDAGATVTTYPIEGGADASDHVVPGTVKAVFECFVSDSPVEEPLSHMFGVRGSIQSTSLDGGTMPDLEVGASANGTKAARYRKRSIKATANVLRFDGDFARRERVYEELDRLREAGTLVTASTLLRSIENAVITNLGAPHSAKDGDGITFRLELTQVRFAETQIVDVPEPEEPRGRRSTDAGATTTSEASPQLESLWHRFAGL